MKTDAHEYQRRWLYGRLGANFGWLVFAFDDQFDGGVADLLIGVVAVAYGDQVIAVAFDKAFGAVLAGFEAFYNVHIVPRGVAVSCWQSACIRWGAQVKRGWTRFVLPTPSLWRRALRPSRCLGLVG